MDSRRIVAVFGWCLLGLCWFLIDNVVGDPVYAEEKSAASSSSVAKKPPTSVKTKLTIDTEKVIGGIFYGYIKSIHPQGLSFVVKETGKKDRQVVFYVDTATKYKMEKKQVPYEKVQPGDKVAVRFFGDDEMLVADAVFVVMGEFIPDDYIAPKKKKGKHS